ncbi:MAG: hypothetical protein IJ002_03600 [Clostridia bacterium]|nr:hypothetical protein [Clostridia bacterium]
MKNYLKKISACLCAAAMILSFVACNNASDETVTSDNTAVTTEKAVDTTEAVVTTEVVAETTEAPATTEAVAETTETITQTTANTVFESPSAYEGLEYKFDVNGTTFYAHHGTWETVEEDGEDKGALHLVDGQGILLIHDLDYSKKVTISSKVKIAADAEPGNVGYAMCAWWNEDGNTNDNWAFFEGEHSGYFYSFLSGKRSAGLIGKFDSGISVNGSTGWESFNAAKIGTYGIPETDLFNAGVLENVVWEQGKYYDFTCTWDAETLTLSTTLDGNPLYSVKFPFYPLSVTGDDFGLRSNIPGVYFKDIVVTAE